MHRTERSGKTFLLYFTFTALCALFFFLGNNYEPFALALLFAARGLFLGFCAASVAAQSGATALLRYRLDTLLSDVGTLLLCLWLAGWAVRLTMELFRAVRGRAARETPGTARRLAVRFAAALALSAAFAAVGAVLAVMGIGGVGR